MELEIKKLKTELDYSHTEYEKLLLINKGLSEQLAYYKSGYIDPIKERPSKLKAIRIISIAINKVLPKFKAELSLHLGKAQKK